MIVIVFNTMTNVTTNLSQIEWYAALHLYWVLLIQFVL